ncbi:MAG: hypothetical protein LBG09_03055 [Puniceicoccales bacterium]|jgi:hypothetical protein|nr:hypothetical protein [Puniceicoccales bacterium]
MSGVKSGIRTDDVTKINNIISPDGAAKGTSLPDVQGQEVKKIGVAPVREDLKKSPVEKEKDEHDRDRFSESDSSRAVMRDANARATKLVDLEGLPE